MSAAPPPDVPPGVPGPVSANAPAGTSLAAPSCAERSRRLAEVMERRGEWPVRSPWIRAAVEALPRHRFAPDRLWHWDGHAYRPVDRAADAARWAEEIYPGPDTATVTQVTDGLATSSLSCQGVVVDILDSLRLEPGHRVLELGTGTGWNAALLAYRAGHGRVTSVETDAGLAATARERLDRAAADVTVAIGDGTGGWPCDAPYDRVVATYAVDRIPWAWIAQTRPGGRIVAPWGRLGHVALTVSADGGAASGWIQGLAQFMPARGSGDRTVLTDFGQIRRQARATAERPWTRDPAPLRKDWHLLFALRVALPDVRIVTAVETDGLNAWLHDGVSSWATLSAGASGATLASQGGPRRLADELEAAWDDWTDVGEPELYEYGLTAEASGRQYAWAHDPDTGPRWPL
ncbi:methyltransferase domain-containing protein [Streptomyces sp. NPDC020965]|uniref:methyltransferase domain-containing protein n=1 Tax=Streptomyces sp. NPDC020965 TaxID=3365105 RepID=UPI00378A58F0